MFNPQLLNRMNTKIRRFVVVTFVLLSATGCLPAWSQGTAFTYQGRLNGTGGPANGLYDLQFTIYDANTNGSQIGNLLTNAAIAVSNGLFAVALDFGTNIFTGPDRWLQIGVRTNGISSFIPLNQRQQITPEPYAIYAANAGSALAAVTAASANAVAATNISGPVTLAQLPPAVITNNESGVNLTGTFNGNGAGLANVPGAFASQVVAGPSVQAAPNTAYLLTNNALVTVTLPTNVNVGDIVKITGAGTNGWQFAQNLGQSILTGFSSGLNLNWTPRIANPNGWSCIASSSDATQLFAAASGPGITGQFYTSTDSGVTWTVLAGSPVEDWSSVACSADGAKLVATTVFDGIYTSTNSGVTWTLQTNALTGVSHEWSSVASSADGTKLIAAEGSPFYNTSQAGGVGFYTSTNSGLTWTFQTGAPTNGGWTCVASSTDGTKLAAVSNGRANCYLSSDSGVTWTPSPTISPTAVALSADATTILTTGAGGIYVSINSGGTWNARPLPGTASLGYHRMAASADGRFYWMRKARVTDKILSTSPTIRV